MGLSVKHLRDLFGGNIPTAQVLQSVASGMADCGVKVIIDPRAKFPYADPQNKQIVLPATVKSSRALLIVSWYVDHESGHIIYTPSFAPILKKYLNNSKMRELCVARGYNGVPDKVLETAKFFLNFVEDVRIEKLMLRRFPGSKKHFIGGPLAAECDTLVEDHIEKAERIAEEQGLKEIPLSPFFVAEMHANAILDGSHGQRERDYVRELVPEHVQWACDVSEDVFGDIVDITQTSCEDLSDRVDRAMTVLLDKLLPDLNQQEEDESTANASGESTCQDGTGSSGLDNFSSEMKASKTPKKSKYDDLRDKEEGGGDDESGSPPGDQGTGRGKESGNSEGEDNGSSGGDEGSDEGSSPGDGASSEGAGESEGSEGGSGSGCSNSGVDSDEDAPGEGSSGGPVDGDADDDGNGEEDQSSSAGGGGDDDSNESDQESASDDGEAEDGSEEGDKSVNEDPKPVTGEIDKNAKFQQVLQWAEDAQVDMTKLMQESGAFASEGDGNDQGAQQTGGYQGATPGSPSITHASDIEGMPQQYLDTMAPGCGVHVIEGLDLENLFNTEDKVFSAYDNFIRSLMPKTLGPAARKLVGKFHGAQGKAWAGNRVNPRMLQPIVAGKAYGRKLYLKRTEPVQSKRGVCVGLLIDCSGSMCSSVPGLQFSNGAYTSKFTIAHVAARSIARLLQTVNVPFAVAGFTTTSMQSYIPSSTGSNYYSASRNQDIVNFLFKGFDDPWTVSEPQMIAMNAGTSVSYKGTDISPQTNSDGESILWLASDMIARKEERKILIVLSDGLPYAGSVDMQSKFLKWAVRRVEIAGIHIGALGLGDRGVEHYYRVHELIDEFPPGYGTELTAPLHIQEKILCLIDKLSD